MPRLFKRVGKNEPRPSTVYAEGARPSTMYTEGARPSSHWARPSTDINYGRRSTERKSRTYVDDDRQILRARHGEHGASFLKGFIPDRACFFYWRPILALMIGDLYMRIALNLLSFQVAKFETGNYFGYTGPMPIFLREYYGAILAGFVGVLVSSVFADSKLTVGIVCLVSSFFALITVTFGFLSAGFFDGNTTKYMSIMMNVFIFSIIVFEPASLALVFDRAVVPSVETSLPVIWTICIFTIWLREVATMIAIIIVFHTKRNQYFGIIINIVTLVFVILYIKMVFIFRQRKESLRNRNITFLSTVLALLLGKARHPNLPKGETHEQNTINEILDNAFSFAQLYKCVLSFAFYYFALQLLFVVWSNQFNEIDLGARFLVLTLLNLINVPIVNVLFIVLYPKMMSKMRIDDLKLLGFAYLLLFLSLVLTTIAQPRADLTQLYTSVLANSKVGASGGSVTKIRFVNEFTHSCWVGCKWLPKHEYDLELNPETVTEYVVKISGTQGEAMRMQCNIIGEMDPQLILQKSVFVQENEITTFILTRIVRAHRFILLLRRVDRFEITGIRPFCDQGPQASLTIYNTIQDSKVRKVTFASKQDQFDVTVPKKMNLRSHVYIPIGTYVSLGYGAQSISSSFGEIFVMLFYKKMNEETFFINKLTSIVCKVPESTTAVPAVIEEKTTEKPQIRPTAQLSTTTTTELPKTLPTVQVSTAKTTEKPQTMPPVQVTVTKATEKPSTTPTVLVNVSKTTVKPKITPTVRNNKTETTEKPQKRPTKQFHRWSVIALYLLSLSQSIESVIMLHFVVTQSPYKLRCVVISLLVLARVFGSALYFATDGIWSRSDPVLAMFVTAVFLVMNGCVYWYTSATYIWPEYQMETNA